MELLSFLVFQVPFIYNPLQASGVAYLHPLKRFSDASRDIDKQHWAVMD